MRHTSRGGEQPIPRITATPADMTSSATTKKAEASALDGPEGTGTSGLLVSGGDLEVSAARATLGEVAGLRGNALSESRHRPRGGLFGVERR
jgi:hypothetical protein